MMVLVYMMVVSGIDVYGVAIPGMDRRGAVSGKKYNPTQ